MECSTTFFNIARCCVRLTGLLCCSAAHHSISDMTPDEYCQDKAAKSGSSFYYSFMFLPTDKRRAITALYAFCREVDDVVDECSDTTVARTTLAWWRGQVADIYSGKPQHPVAIALIP